MLVTEPCPVKPADFSAKTGSSKDYIGAARNPYRYPTYDLPKRAKVGYAHPNTVEVYDYGRAEDGTFSYAMEYLPGLTLDHLGRRHGPLPPARAIHLLRQVCGALREAHGVGLIHRDIKSVNLAAGTYTLTFAAAQRGNVQASSQTFQVLVDGIAVGTFTPAGTSYSTFVTGNFTVTAGAHTIQFVGLDPNGGDNTAFIDNVQLLAH